jgi:putative transposase
MTLFNEYHRIESNRLKHWNYYGSGKYFITVCTKNHENYFGEITKGLLTINELGKEVENQWLATPHIRPDMNISLDEYQIMPNHFHGIIDIGWNKFNKIFFDTRSHPENERESDYDDKIKCDSTAGGVTKIDSPAGGVETQGLASLPHPYEMTSLPHPNEIFNSVPVSPNSYISTFGPQSNNLGSIMRGFKSAVTMFARKNKMLFDWQRSYHDIIIRDDRSLEVIRRYIRNNVRNWEGDRFRKI